MFIDKFFHYENKYDDYDYGTRTKYNFLPNINNLLYYYITRCTLLLRVTRQANRMWTLIEIKSKPLFSFQLCHFWYNIFELFKAGQRLNEMG